MGSNLNGFDVELTFGPDGGVEKIDYVDQAGCGHSRVMSAELYLSDVVRYHLDHYRECHDRVPPKRCDFEVKSLKNDLTFKCALEPHDKYTKHRLEQV